MAASGCCSSHGILGGGAQFLGRVACGRWFMLFASTMIMAMSGGAYIFGAYSKALKASLQYDQDTLNTISFSKNIGISLGIVSGLINEVAPPWVVLLAGAAMNLAGYLMVYLAVVSSSAGGGGAAHRPPPVWLMCFYVFLGTISQTFASTGAIVTSVKNFPNDRGVVLGMLMGYAGFSGAIFTQLCRGAGAGGEEEEDGAATVLLILAWLPTIVSLLFSFTVRVIPRTSSSSPATERRGVLGFLGVSVVIGVYLLVLNVVEVVKASRLPTHVYHLTNALLLLVLVAGPLAVVVKQESSNSPPPATPPSPPPPSDDDDSVSVVQALRSKHMALLFVTTACGVGGMMTAVDNMSQIGQSLGHTPRTIRLLVALVSLSNYAGRVLAGVCSDRAVARHGLPRPLALAAALLVAAVAGHLLIAAGWRDALYAAAAAVGFCVGAVWTVLFAVVSEVFGLRHFSTLFNLSTLASPVGSYALGVQVAGRLYDRQARRQQRRVHRRAADHGDGEAVGCVGVECFRASFEIIAAVTLVGMAVSMVMAWRTRAFYQARFFSASVRNGGTVVLQQSQAGGVMTTDSDDREGGGGVDLTTTDQNKTIATSQSIC